MWFVPMQTASYKGVSFEVISTEDSAERAVVEHLYPYVNGGDLEDMGLNAKQVQLQAIFNGEGYYTDLKKFLAVMAEAGTGVLVHPILGRMPNMLCVSYRVRHDAENVNYCALDLTFREATEAEAIFVFQNVSLALMDSLFTSIEDYLAQAQAWYSSAMVFASSALNLRNKLLGYWGSVYGTVMSLRQFFKTNGKNSAHHVTSLPKSVSKASLVSQSSQAVEMISQLLQEELGAVFALHAVNHEDDVVLSVNAGFNEVLRIVEQIEPLAMNLATGKGESATNRYEQFNLGGVALNRENVKLMDGMLKLLCTAELVRMGMQIFEQQGERLSPAEIEYITTTLRIKLLGALEVVRASQQEEMAGQAIDLPNTAVYEASYQMMEQIRQMAYDLTQLARALINQKPPLVVKTSPLCGTLQQVAHAFYGDYRRANELLRLNPQIRQPNFIREGDLLNAYAK